MKSDQPSEVSDLAQAGESFELWPPSREHEIAKLIRRRRFKISDFTWRVESLRGLIIPNGPEFEPGIVPVLVRKPTHFYFVFDIRCQDIGVFRVVMSPYGTRPEGAAIEVSWSRVLEQHLDAWLRSVRSEGKPDPWAEIRKHPGLSQALDSVTDEPFTPEQQKRVDAALDQFRHDLTQQMPDASDHQKTQLGRLDERIAFLKQEARTQSKRAWYFMFVGAMATVSAQLFLQPDQVRALLQMLGTAVNQIFGGPALLQ